MAVPVRAGADLRLLRAAVFSAVCVTVSAVGHELASGVGIAPWTVLLGWAGVLGVVVPLAGRERSLSGIAGAVLGSEFGLHVLFCMGQRSVPAVSARGSASVMALAAQLWCAPGSAHLTAQRAVQIVRMTNIDPVIPRGMPAMAGMPGMAGGTNAGMHAMGAMSLGSMFTPSMLAAHTVAALIAGWLLRRGEAALWQAVRLFASAARRAILMPVWFLLAALRIAASVVEVVRRCFSPPHRDRARGAGLRSSVALEHVVVRRGPPAAAAAV